MATELSMRPRRSNLVRRRRRAASVALAACLCCIVAELANAGPAQALNTTATATQSSPATAIAARAAVVGSRWDPITISAPGGPYLRDALGRVVVLHGVNAVYKHAPYELAIAPGRPFNFSSADAALIAGAGFNLVRLGLLWQGLEPGGASNDPVVCAPGAPRRPNRYSARVARSYLARVSAVVALLGRYHVHALIDMHQDVYAQAFRGEGAPPWAVCTDDRPVVVLKGRWSRNYASPSLNIAEGHFWHNDVVGNLQGEYDRVWAAVAASFKDNPWVVGYDPYNEPFSRQAGVASQLECFYTGRAHPGLAPGTDTTLACPATDPPVGVVGSIEAADPNHLVFVEPDIYTADHAPVRLGAMPFPRLVYNVHAYCGHRNPVTGDPVSASVCAARVFSQLQSRSAERLSLASPAQPGGPPMFLSEFGATDDAAVLRAVAAKAAQMDLGWTYWSWKYYADPTGSADEPLAAPDGHLLPNAEAIAVPYAEAIAGIPTQTAYDSSNRVFTFSYVPDPSVKAPSVIITAPARYPGGYCATASGATIGSPPGVSHLLLENEPGARSVSFTLAPGICPAAARTAGALRAVEPWWDPQQRSGPGV